MPFKEWHRGPGGRNGGSGQGFHHLQATSGHAARHSDNDMPAPAHEKRDLPDEGNSASTCSVTIFVIADRLLRNPRKSSIVGPNCRRLLAFFPM